MSGTLCPFCGAYMTSQCEIEDDADGCPWEEMLDAEPDPDILREDWLERQRLAKEYPAQTEGEEG